jgi:hypothetical protein
MGCPWVCSALFLVYYEMTMLRRIIQETLVRWVDGKNRLRNVVLDAEMVAYSDHLDSIDGGCAITLHATGIDVHWIEFWRISRLVEDTAHGVRAARRLNRTIQPLQNQTEEYVDCHCSRMS